VIGQCIFFSKKIKEEENEKSFNKGILVSHDGVIKFDLEQLYNYEDNLPEFKKGAIVDRDIYAIVTFDRPTFCPLQSMFIGSKLDADITLNQCRLAFSGQILKPITKDDLSLIKICKDKEKSGVIERINDCKNVLIKDLFKKETNFKLLIGMIVISKKTGENGIIQSTFGTKGKLKVYFENGITGNPEERDVDVLSELVESEVVLKFKKLIYDKKNEMMQI
jgi:hypothetical protein